MDLNDNPPIAPEPGAACKSKIEKELLKVASVDLRIDENAKAHRTNRFEHTQSREASHDHPHAAEPCLVVRRGEPFDIVIRFDRPFDSQKDDIRLIFDFGEKTRESTGSRAVLRLNDEDKPKNWAAKVESQNGETATLRIVTPPTAAVGKWKFSLDLVLVDGNSVHPFRYRISYPVYILFNPWCPDDQVFMSDESWRNEYVLNDTGILFYGTQYQISPKPWSFGQFFDVVLDVSVLLLEMSKLPFNKRGNPVEIVRKISALVNHQDEKGVLFGNWESDPSEFADGTLPTHWNGSVEILDEFWRTRNPVKYGQCWVFSGLVTSVCRALGIPCRSVTNFESGHDTDGSLTIDKYIDEEGKRLSIEGVWNFHVWNEVWMTREDLEPGYGGWQVIDATPQETSGNVFCAGPASVEAIRQGRVHLPYDGSFIFAEVNADFATFQRTGNKTSLYSVAENAIGKFISTKELNSDDKLDITNLYKSPEGSQEERTVFLQAASTCTTFKKEYQLKPTAKDVNIGLVQIETVQIGQPLDFILKLKNRSKKKEVRTVKTTITVTIVLYTGITVATVMSQSQEIILQPDAAEKVTVTVDVKDYLDQVTESCQLNVVAISHVQETNQTDYENVTITFCKPNIDIKVLPKKDVDNEYEIVATFTNPLPKTLTQCEFSLEAAGLLRPIKLPHADVLPNGIAKCYQKIRPLTEGKKVLIVGFWSKELSGITGKATINITKY